MKQRPTGILFAILSAVGLITTENSTVEKGKSQKQLTYDMPDSFRYAQPSPLNGKNRAQRARVLNGFIAVA